MLVVPPVHAELNLSEPGRREGALGPYLRAVAAHRLLVLVVIAAVLAGAAAYLSVRDAEYEATAEILVTPLPREDLTFIGLQFLRDSGDPTRTIQTAAEIVTSAETAQATATRVGGYSRKGVEDAVDVEPRGESNILAVSARATDPQRAQQLANTYAEAALQQRVQILQQSVDVAIERLTQRQQELVRSGNQVAVAEVAARLSQLEGVREGNDPTLSLVHRATVPSDQIGAAPWLVLVLALLGGLALGMAAALLAELAERRVRDEEELQALYPIPVLTRVPLTKTARRDGAVSMPPHVLEAYRLLGAQFQRPSGSGRLVMVTSASQGDGKTSSVVNLGLACVAAGQTALVIDLDLRKPDLARILGVDGEPGLSSLLGAPDRTLRDVVVPSPMLPLLQIVPAGRAESGSLLLHALQQRLPALLDEARSLADFVLIDTSPLGEIGDALTIAPRCDEIVIVTRPGHTDRWRLRQLRELLDRAGISPKGFVLLGEGPGVSAAYHGYGYGAPSNGDEPRRRRPLSRSRR